MTVTHSVLAIAACLDLGIDANRKFAAKDEMRRKTVLWELSPGMTYVVYVQVLENAGTGQGLPRKNAREYKK